MGIQIGNNTQVPNFSTGNQVKFKQNFNLSPVDQLSEDTFEKKECLKRRKGLSLQALQQQRLSLEFS